MLEAELGIQISVCLNILSTSYYKSSICKSKFWQPFHTEQNVKQESEQPLEIINLHILTLY